MASLPVLSDVLMQPAEVAFSPPTGTAQFTGFPPGLVTGPFRFYAMPGMIGYGVPRIDNAQITVGGALTWAGVVPECYRPPVTFHFPIALSHSLAFGAVDTDGTLTITSDVIGAPFPPNFQFNLMPGVAWMSTTYNKVDR